MKTLSINGQDTSENETKEVFVIVAANLEYNDETYDQWGELLLKKNYYYSLDEALDNYIHLIKLMFGSLRIYEIHELLDLHDFMVNDVITASGAIKADECEMSLHDVINTSIEYYAVDCHTIYSTCSNLLRIVRLEK